MKEISKALVLAQGKMGKAIKDSTNPHFRSKYADLGNVIDACLPALNAAGIAVIQPPYDDETGRYIKTILIHGESGEILECRVPLTIGKNDMQGYGSAMTYARRYGLMSMVGIAPEDDDGNGAQGPQDSSKPNSKGNTKAKDKSQHKEDVKATREEIDGYLNSNWLTADKKDAGKKFMAGNPPLEKLEKFRDSLLKIYGEWQAGQDGKAEKPADKPPERQWECLVCGTKSADGTDASTAGWTLVAAQQSGPHTALCKSHYGETADSLLSQADQAEEEGRKDDALWYSRAAGILADMEAAT